jgi:hypothetical protein
MTWNKLVLPDIERHQGERKEPARNQKGKTLEDILRLFIH